MSGGDAVLLGGGPVGQVELLVGELGGAGVGDVLAEAGQEILHLEHGLDGALAVGGAVPDDDGAAVVLQGAGEDLGGRGAETGGQHGERAVITDGGVGVAVHLQAAHRVAHLHDRALVDEEAGEVDSLGEQAAAVAAQVDDEGLDALVLQLADEFGHVLCRGVLVEIGRAHV